MYRVNSTRQYVAMCGRVGVTVTFNVHLNMKQPNEAQYKALERDITRLLKSLKADIGDEYRACEDDDCPGMQVTIGATPDEETGELSWSYQTGDNSFTGGAYGHRHWGVIYLYRRSNSVELAVGAISEIADSIASSCETVIAERQ